jgi:hypothetical protein
MLLNDYMAAHGEGPIDLNDVFRWARQHKLWEPPAAKMISIFKREMARAAREEYYTDPQGRKVRKKHAVVFTKDEKQQSLWDDITTATPNHMKMSLQQRRRGALGEVVQTKTDMDSYNDNNRYGAEIQMSFNFDEDLAELAQPAEYPEAPPEEKES